MDINWNSPALNRIMWILDHLENLNVSCDEAMVLLVIQFCNDTGIPVSHEAIHQKTKLSIDQIESIFNSLSQKGFLRIDFVDGKIVFLLDGLVHGTSMTGSPLETDLLSAFEQEFGRALSPNEMERILEMKNHFGQRMMMVALNDAIANEKLNLNYIENVMAIWKRKNYTEEDVERGKR